MKVLCINVNMDPVENYSEELQNQSEEVQLSSRPSLSHVKKSWGFRRTTIARREFLEEVGELAHSPPPVRKTRSRRSNQTPLTTLETQESLRDTPTTRSVLDELEWSAPSSPVAEDNKPGTETYAGGSLDPILWQDCGSAFHTAFSLLGGGESFQVEMPDALAVPDPVEATDSIEPYDSCITEEPSVPNDESFPDDIHEGETLVRDIDETLTQKGVQEPKYTTRGVRGRKERARPCAVDESAKPNNDGSPDGEMLLREMEETLTRKCAQEQRGTTTRGVRGGKGRGRLCDSAMLSTEDSADGRTHAVLGDVGAHSDVVLISPQEGGHSVGQMLLRGTRKMLTRKSRQEQRATKVRRVTGGKGNSTPCATGESAMPVSEDAPDDLAHSVLGGVRLDSDVVLISPQEEADSDEEMTLIQIGKLPAPGVGQEQRDTTVRGGKGKGRKKGRGRGRKKAKGRGKGRGKAGGLQFKAVDEEVLIVNPTEEEQEVEKMNVPDSPIQISTSPAQSVSSLSPQRSSSDCIFVESDVDQDQFEDAPEQKNKEGNSNEEPPPGLEPEDHDPDALICICRQKRSDRFLVRCVGCQQWFHGNCVGISEAGGGTAYVCSACVLKNQSEHQPDRRPQLEDERSLRRDEDKQEESEPQAAEDPEMVAEEKERTEAPGINLEPEPQAKLKKEGILPLCIGPGCPREALPDSVYCGTDCILQHAAATMKTFSVPKESKTGGGIQKKPAATTASAKDQRSSGTSKNFGAKAEDEEKKKDDGGGQEEAGPPSPCVPAPTEVQATSLPSSKLDTAPEMEKTQEVEAVAPLNQSLEDSAAGVAPSSQPVSEPETPKEPVNSSLSSDTRPCTPPKSEQNCQAAVPETPSTSVPSHRETGALTVGKKAFIIPKKPPAPQPSSSPALASSSGPKPPPAPAPLNETRNLLVPPAPSAPSSRPSQPNNQIRQSIQKSLVSILVKRVGDCEDLKTSESEVVKLVASIEVEMFNIFRNTDSKYMNKYRTIMFNLKDPRNKGLLYGFVRGEISPFRLVRMTQKDMQAIKATETPEKQTLEVKDAAAAAAAPAKVTGVLPKPEAVKVDLASLNPARPNRSTEHKKSLPPPAVKTKTIQPIQSSPVPDILTCMLKDTTSEHKTHIFDLKCKICTGQISAADEEEPIRKKPRVSETRDINYPSWRKSTEEDSPLHAPPESPDLDSPTLFIMDTSSHLIIDSPVLTIVESPASPIMDSPASPVLESPASPAMESPASPTPDPPKASTSKSAFTPVVNPAASTTTITRRDPRTAANRFPALSNNQPAPYAPPKETRLVPQAAPGSLPPPPPTKMIPKSILKPLSADPRFYSSLSRSVASEPLSVDETSQFLAKQEILWKGFINMLTVAKLVSKAYLVSGSAENLKADLPDTIQIGGRILPETVWDYMEKVKMSVTKESCVIRFHPATEEEEVAYVSLFSYFSSRRRFGVVASGNRSIKDLYLVPLGANESVPSMLQPLEGPGLETKRPNLLLGLAIIQRTKRLGNFPQEIEEKRPKVHLAKDPMWIPKPPVLYGSDNLDVFQPYDPETPANLVLPSSPSCPDLPSDSSSSLTQPSLLPSVRPNPTVALTVTAPATPSTSSRVPDKPPVTPSSDKTPLQTILNSLFSSKPTESAASSNVNSTNTSCVKKPQALSQVAGTMVDPIVQQYGQKFKIKEIEEKNDFDRPYDPEEYDPGVGYGMTTVKSIDKNQVEGPAVSKSVEDDVAYDPEDETIFADVSGIPAKPLSQSQTLESSSCDTPVSTPDVATTPASTTSSDGIAPNLPSGTVVVSAATLNEQQRMLEELNKQIEEQKRQLKEQEEALRQQREAVGMFMAHFSVSDSMMSPPTKSLPLSQLTSLKAQAETNPSEVTDKTSKCTEISSSTEKQPVEPQATKVLKDDTDIVIADPDKTNTEGVEKEGERYSSAGEIEDSDVAYDPEDESFFREVEEEPLEGNSGKTYDRALSRRIRGSSLKGSQNSSHRKRRLSPKRRSHRERDHRRSPSKRSQRRSSSHSQKKRDRHRRSDRDRSRHRGRDRSERLGRHRKEHNAHRQSRGRRSPSTLEQQVHVSFSPEHEEGICSEPETALGPIKTEPDEQKVKPNCGENLDVSCSTFSHDPLPTVNPKIREQPTSDELLKKSFSNDDQAQGASMQVNKPVKQQDQIESKIESTIPLREIDPPLRDSPESPDPDPQFVKPSSIETQDTANTEKMQSAGTLFSGPISAVPGMPPTSSSNLIQSKQGGVMMEPRTAERPPAAEMEVNISESEKIDDRQGVNFQQYKNVEPNVLGRGTKSGSDCNILAGSGSTIPREERIFPPNGRRIEQTSQGDRPFIPNITNPRWRGHNLPAPGMRIQRCQKTGFDPHVEDPHCTVEESNMQDHWSGPNRRGAGVVRGRGGPFVQDERKHQLQWGPNIDNLRHNRNSPTGQGFMIPGPDTEGHMHDGRDPGNPHSRRRDPERGGPNNDIGGHRGATLVEGPGPNQRGQTAPVFRESEPWLEQRNIPMKSAEAGPRNPPSLGPNYLELEPENRGYPMDCPGNNEEELQGPNFRGPEQYLNHPRSAKRGLGSLEFKGPGLNRSLREAPDSNRRGPDKGNFFHDRTGRRGPDFLEDPEADWRGLPIEGSGHMGTSLGGPMGTLKPRRIGCPGPESWRPQAGTGDTNTDGPGPDEMAPDSQNLGALEPDYPGAWTRGSGPDFMGMRPEKPGPSHFTRRQGDEPFRISDQERQFRNMEDPDGANFRGPGLERKPQWNERPNNSKGFPDRPQFIMSAPERRSPAMDGCESDKRCLPFRGVKPEESALDDPTNIKRGFRDLDPNRQSCENIGPDIRGPEPNRQEQGVPRLRGTGDEFAPGMRHKDSITESRPRRDNWHKPEFVGLEPVQGVPDMDNPGSKETSHTFRGPRGTKVRGPRSERWSGPNLRDSFLERKGMDLREQWAEKRDPNTDCELHQDIGPRFLHEGPDEQFQCRQDPMEWRIPGNRGPKMMQGRGSGCEFRGSNFRRPGLVRDHPSMAHPGSTREEFRKEFMGQDSDEPHRWGSGIPFRGSRDPDNRRKTHDRRTPVMRGSRSDLRVSPDMESEFGHPDFRDDTRDSNMEGHQPFSRGPGFESSCLNRREEMEDLERRVPQGLGPECHQSESRNFAFDGPEASRRFSDSGRMRSERQGDNTPRFIRGASEESRRVNRAPNMRRLGPDETSVRDLEAEGLGVRHGPGRWDPPSAGSRSESRRGRPALTRFNSPSEVARFQGSSGPPCSVEQSQQGGQPQQRKAALLPTPTGPMCFPTHAMKNPGSFGPDGKHMGLPRGRGRGRSVSRNR